MQETTGSSVHEVNLSEYIDNTGRHSSRTQCPIPTEQLEDYRRTTIKLKDGTSNTFDDKYRTLDAPNNALWKRETAFRTKKGTTLPETLQQQLASKTQPESAPQKVTPQVIRHNPKTRLREKTAPPTPQDSAAPRTITGAAGHGIPHPSKVHPRGDYWYREGPYWKRVYIKPRTAFYILEPDNNRLLPWRQTKVQPVGERRNTRSANDEWTTQQAKTSDMPWTGWTNFEEHLHNSNQMMKNNDKEQKRK